MIADRGKAGVREQIFNGKIVDLVLLDGKWEIAHHADAVGILIARQRQVLGVSQLRPAIGRVSWEIPAGLIDPGETPLEAAAREAAEEVQLGGRLQLIGRFFSSPGFTDEEVHLFELLDHVPAAGVPDPDEKLTPHWRDALAAWRDVLDGKLATSSVTALALRHVLARHGISP